MNKLGAVSGILVALVWMSMPAFADETLLPGDKLVVEIPLDKREIRWIKSSGLSGYKMAKIGIAVPESFNPDTTYPILVTCVTGDRYLNNIDEMDKYWPQSISAGWVVVTGWADPHPDRDTKAYRRAVTVAALRGLKEIIPQSENWAIAVAGFSGGSKNSAITAAYLQKEGYRITGLFMGGCNEDLASYAMKKISPDKKAFRAIPVFLSTGVSDAVSTVEDTKSVVNSLSKSGFTKIRMETYPGRHSLNRNHIPIALDWFKTVEGATGIPACRVESRRSKD